MKISKQQAGFAIVELVGILIIIGLLSGVGWWVYQSNQKTKQSLDNASKSDVPIVKKTEKKTEKINATKETDSWLEFKNNYFSIRLADGWKITQQTDNEDGLLYGDQLTYKQGTKAVIEKTTGGRDGICCFIVAYDKTARSMSEIEKLSTETTQLTTDAGQKVTKYKYTVSADDEFGMGPAKGSVVYNFYLKGDSGNGLYFDYTLTPGATNNLEVVEKVIKTAKFL